VLQKPTTLSYEHNLLAFTDAELDMSGPQNSFLNVSETICLTLVLTLTHMELTHSDVVGVSTSHHSADGPFTPSVSGENGAQSLLT
jgi:hypothetical protein